MSGTAVVHSWLASPLPRDVALAIEKLARIEDVGRIAVLPDVHLAEEVCVGLVVATRQTIYPAAVGSDIGCGMAAIGFDIDADRLCDASVAARILAGFQRVIPAIRHGPSTIVDSLPESLCERPLSHTRLEAMKRRDGRVEYATLGRGNHFLELQRCDAGRLWLMLHSGSRAIGPAVLAHHHALAGDAAPALFGLIEGSRTFDDYIADVAWAVDYAEASRRAMVGAAARVVGDVLGCAPLPETLITCNHNHVRRETHFDEALLVHRKGAMGLPRGATGVVPGSMGSPSYHVEGRGAPAALDSSAHGAGRLLARGAARRAISVRALEQQMEGVWFDHRAAHRLLDEAQSAYKDVSAVMRAQRDLVRVLRKLDPLLSYKAI
jgi:tRNA-splicing ligase RtcB (3'-phosphate/5'-hydroxy nucleic acid ligase)